MEAGLFDRFSFFHADGDAGDQWQFPGRKDPYTPRVYFLDHKGSGILNIEGWDARYPFGISSADAFIGSAKKALELTGFDPEEHAKDAKDAKEEL